MKFTIDTYHKTITLHGSFKFEELVDMRRGLHPNWLDFTITVEQPINYPIWTYGTSTNPLEPPFKVTCSSSSVDTATGQHKLNFGD